MNRAQTPQAQLRWERLQQQPEAALSWDWYALLRLVQAATPERRRLGYGVQLTDDPVRLGQFPFLHPPACAVAALRSHGLNEEKVSGAMAQDGSSVPWLYSYHFGLFGPFGPLPLHLTEVAYRQARSRDPGLAAFCDVLHHRFQCFFFRAWADARKEMELDRPIPRLESADHDSDNLPSEPWTTGERLWDLYVGALVGLGLHALRQRDRVPDHAKLYYAGRLLQPTHNGEGLQAIIGDYFEVPAAVIPFVGRTVRLPREVRCRFSADETIGRLGLSAILGESYEDHQLGFRVRLGPLDFEQFEDFLPQSAGLGELHDWIRLYVGRETDPNPEAELEAVWDLQLVLRGSEVPPLRLGHGRRLGYTTWVTSQPCPDDVDDLVLHPPADDRWISKTSLKNAAEAAAGVTL